MKLYCIYRIFNDYESYSDDFIGAFDELDKAKLAIIKWEKENGHQYVSYEIEEYELNKIEW
jgi:hypothetical protein